MATEPKPRKYDSSNRCQICRHPQRSQIELMHIGGVGMDQIAARFGVERNAVWRHNKNHITEAQKAAILVGPAKLGDLIEVAAEEHGSALDHYRIMRSILMAQLTKQAEKGDLYGIALAADRLTHVLRDMSKLGGEISTFANSTVINVTQNNMILNSAPFADLQAGLLEVCAAHPEARSDIVRLFKRLDDKYSQQKALEAPPMREIIEGAHAHHAA